MHATVATSIALALEKAIHQALEYDPGSKQKLSRLANKTLHLESTLPSLSLFFHFAHRQKNGPTHVQVMAYSEHPVDSKLRGTLPGLLSLVFGNQHHFSEQGISLSGSTAVLTELQNILHTLEIDWQQCIVDMGHHTLAGKMFLNFIANSMNTGFSWAKKAQQKASVQAKTYLEEEIRLLPTTSELEFFYADVNKVREGTERLSARLSLLTEKHAEAKS